MGSCRNDSKFHELQHFFVFFFAKGQDVENKMFDNQDKTVIITQRQKTIFGCILGLINLKNVIKVREHSWDPGRLFVGNIQNIARFNMSLCRSVT